MLPIWTNCFVLLAIDDGSFDRTRSILEDLRDVHGTKLEIISHRNRGHGQTCLVGYRVAIARKIPFILQVDSDGQSDPRFFSSLWKLRENFDVVYGYRSRRDDGWRRVVVTLILRNALLFFANVDCRDANVPYRLMQTQAVTSSVDSIPPDFFLANVALAVQLKRKSNIRHAYVPIHFRARFAGEPTIPISSFWRRAIELVKQLHTLPR